MRARVVAGRVLLGLVAMFLLVSGVDHFVSRGALAEHYASLGWPPSVTAVIGLIQLLGAAMLLVPRVQRLGAVIVTCVLAVLLGRQFMRGQEMLLFLEPAFWMIAACIAGALLLPFRVRDSARGSRE